GLGRDAELKPVRPDGPPRVRGADRTHPGQQYGRPQPCQRAGRRDHLCQEDRTGRPGIRRPRGCGFGCAGYVGHALSRRCTMKTPLAWRNLLHDKPRTAVGVGGVAFAVFLVLMQLGFLGAVESTATVIYSALEFDLLLRSPEYLHFAKTGTFPAMRLRQAASAPGVKWARPIHTAMAPWRTPTSDPQEDGTIRVLLTMGVDPQAPVFGRADIAAEVTKLQRPDYVLIDRQSRREFGPVNQQRFGPED